MALINCPECNKSVSNYATTCPHCGYPLQEQFTEPREEMSDYCIVLKRAGGNYKGVFELIQNINHINLLQTVELTQKLPAEIISNLTKQDADELLDRFLSIGADAIIINNAKQSIDNLPIYCPQCGSTQITTGTKGYGLIRGFLGSNKTVNRCGKCGYSWEP